MFWRVKTLRKQARGREEFNQENTSKRRFVNRVQRYEKKNRITAYPAAGLYKKLLSFAFDDDTDSEQQNFEVGFQTHVIQVDDVVVQSVYHLIQGVCVAYFDRPPRGEPRSDAVNQTVVGRTLRYFVDVEFALGTWPDKTHFAFEYVPKLRHLVQPVFAQPTSDGSGAFVVRRT